MGKIFLAALLAYATINAASSSSEIDLTGTVKDDKSTAIKGVTVTLVKQAKLTATTDSLGAFAIKSTVGIITRQNTLENMKISSKGVNLELTLTSASNEVALDIYATDGRMVASVHQQNVAAGSQMITMPQMSPGSYLMALHLDNGTVVRKAIHTGVALYLSDATEQSLPAFLRTSATSATAVDTLVATKSGYKTVKTAITSYTQKSIAIVMAKDTVPPGGVCATAIPKLPAPSAITYSNAKHPGPFDFKFMDLPRVTTKAQWECRRAEILAMAQEYLYGHLPPKCEVVGTVSGGNIKAECKYNGKTATVSCNASGSGDILVIEFGSGAPKPANSRSASMNTSTMLSTAKSLFGSSDMGICMAGAWGVGRIIDALEQNPNSGINPKKVMTTGCSTGGKQALIAGVFEPRVALCVPVESGCGGSCSWRVSKQYGNGDSNKDCQDITHLEQNWLGTVADPWAKGSVKVDKLPLDQGELMALRAPGASMCFNNYKEWKWLCSKGNVSAAQGCRWIYKALGVPNNFGFAESKADHPHCTFPSEHTAQLNAFYDKFLNGKEANTDVMQWHAESDEKTKWFDFGTGKDQWDTNLVLQ